VSVSASIRAPGGSVVIVIVIGEVRAFLAESARDKIEKVWAYIHH
jgi:hypothetical protein